MASGAAVVLGPYDFDDGSTIEAAVTGAYVTDNDKWVGYTESNGQKLWIIHVEGDPN